ncbi:flagellar biosynthesis regulator FlaF [Roseicitreum antarcticum]|uniref:Flagellar protein FlaF n=1 Tax=Roseicitreum antarcticum TaxID=564137 RepID=A0A1H2XB30_9RHOB|nr:flagellar biosynthesis regulator FlaF [Roseicitreum antarcticum]SDW90021.1 flagellar protein FlaF [Roseicitreum antarcticum]
MSVSSLARSVYTNPASAMRVPRDTEFELLARITRKLRNTADQPLRYVEFVEALNDNRNLWAAFAIDLVEDDNKLPDALRRSLVYLAQFTIQHTDKLLVGDGSADILLDINTAVMRGLRGHGAAP